MGLFDKLFGGKTPPPTPPTPTSPRSPLQGPPPLPGAPQPPPLPPSAGTTPAAAPGAAAGQSDMVKVFDKFGRELHVPRREWLNSVLLPNMEKAWHDPEKLAGYLINGLQDGYSAELLKAAERLAATDPDAERGAVLHAITLLKSGRVEESGRVLLAHTARHGESGAVLVNLAKVHHAGNNAPLALDTLWRGLVLDPNMDNAVRWYAALHREKGGDACCLEALGRIAALPGSWRAQVVLAHAALGERDLDRALALYAECLARAPRPVPTDVLMQMSGDLGTQGHLPELVNLTAPHFSPEVHGVTVGSNLMKGYLDLGQLEQARAILDQLYAQQRPDWKEDLAFWDTELAKAALQTQPTPDAGKLEITLLTIEGPVWLKPDSPAVELFPARPEAGPTVCFLGGSAEYATNSKKVEHQMADAAGRVSRALPLYLAEQLHWSTDAQVSTLVPWLEGPSPGFVVTGGAWEAAQAAHFARQGRQAHDYVVTVNLKVQSEPWFAELHLIRTIDGTSLGTLSASFTTATPEAALPALARQLAALLRQETGATPLPLPAAYAVPQGPGPGFADYLLRLEQLLAVRCAGMEGVPRGFLNGEREILDGNLQLCLAHPGSLAVRLLFAQTLMSMKRARPDVVTEFREKAVLLQKEHPLPDAARGVTDRLINEALAS